MKNTEIVEKVARWAEKKGFKRIKANCESYETPKQYLKPAEEKAIIPDATGMRNGRKSYFEIATKTDNIRSKVSKWKLLSTLASRTGGKLFLLAPRGHKAFAERLIKNNLLMAEVIYLK